MLNENNEDIEKDYLNINNIIKEFKEKQQVLVNEGQEPVIVYEPIHNIGDGIKDNHMYSQIKDILIRITRIESKDEYYPNKKDFYYLYFNFPYLEGNIMKNIEINDEVIYDIKNNKDISSTLFFNPIFGGNITECALKFNNKEQINNKPKIIIPVKNRCQHGLYSPYYKYVDKYISNNTILPCNIKYINEEDGDQKVNYYYVDNCKIEINKFNILYKIIENDYYFKDNYKLYVSFTLILIPGPKIRRQMIKGAILNDDLICKNGEIISLKDLYVSIYDDYGNKKI